MSLWVLVLDGAFDLGLAAVLDTLSTADSLGSMRGASARFSPRIVSVRRKVTTGHRLVVPAERAQGLERPEVIVVPALAAKTPEALAERLSRADIADACALLRRHHEAGTRICAACTGTFVLGEAGILDGRAATTSWWLGPYFRQRYPNVDLDESRMVVDAKSVITAGAALSHVDFGLWLVRRKSPSLAALTARYLVIDSRPSQALYAIPDHLAHTDPVVEKFERWAHRELAEPFSLGRAARSLGVSERTLARRLHRVLGKSPLAYVHDLRVERAVHALRTSDATVDEIAVTVGYENGVSLRNLLRRQTGSGVKALRVRP